MRVRPRDAHKENTEANAEESSAAPKELAPLGALLPSIGLPRGPRGPHADGMRPEAEASDAHGIRSSCSSHGRGPSGVGAKGPASCCGLEDADGSLDGDGSRSDGEPRALRSGADCASEPRLRRVDRSTPLLPSIAEVCAGNGSPRHAEEHHEEHRTEAVKAAELSRTAASASEGACATSEQLGELAALRERVAELVAERDQMRRERDAARAEAQALHERCAVSPQSGCSPQERRRSVASQVQSLSRAVAAMRRIREAQETLEFCAGTAY